MAAPTRKSLARVKRLAWCLADFTRLVCGYSREETAGEDATHVFADKGFADCPRGLPPHPQVYKRGAHSCSQAGDQVTVGRPIDRSVA